MDLILKNNSFNVLSFTLNVNSDDFITKKVKSDFEKT